MREPTSERDIWWGNVNQPIEVERAAALRQDVLDYLNAQPELFVRDVHAGAHPDYRTSVRFVTPNAWHAMFVYNMFLRPTAGE